MAEEHHNRLRAKRAANRAVVTRIIDESEEILEYDSTPQDVRSKNRLIRILTMLKEKMKLLIDLDDKILDGVTVDDITKEIEEAEFFKMKIMDAIAKIKSSNTLSASITPTQTPSFSHPDPSASHTQHKPLDSTHQGISNTQHQMAGLSLHQVNTTNSIPPAPPLSPSTNSTPHNIENPAVQTTKSRLPKIVWARLKGEVTQFRSFWDSFESTVHLNPVLTKIYKFNYLTSLPKGTASLAIAGLPITKENYAAAMDIIWYPRTNLINFVTFMTNWVLTYEL